MTFEQALEAMKNGKRVKHSSWDKCIKLDNRNGKQVILQHEHNGVSSIYDKIPVKWITLDGWIEEGD